MGIERFIQEKKRELAREEIAREHYLLALKKALETFQLIRESAEVSPYEGVSTEPIEIKPGIFAFLREILVVGIDADDTYTESAEILFRFEDRFVPYATIPLAGAKISYEDPSPHTSGYNEDADREVINVLDQILEHQKQLGQTGQS